MALCGILTVWLFSVSLDDTACFDLVLMKEGQSSSTSPGFSPPLTINCDVTGRGSAVTASYFPRFEYELCLAFGCFVGFALWFGLQPSRRTALWCLLGYLAAFGLVVLAFTFG
jgi:hypothetical protein